MEKTALAIALSEILTRELLLREVFNGEKNTFKIRKQKKQLLKMIDEILEEYEGRYYWVVDEAFVIYSFLRLLENGNVEGIRFKEAWRIHIFRIATRYRDTYDDLIMKRQQELKKNLIV